MTRADQLVSRYSFDPHCENGIYIECHYPAPTDEIRPASGSMYYVVRPGERTKFHRIDCDEYWCFNAGTTLQLWAIGLDGRLRIINVGLEAGAEPMVRFAAGEIFASRLPDDAPDCAFMTCITVPRFTYDGLEMFTEEEITARYPETKAFYE